jgi:hypothetical protein
LLRSRIPSGGASVSPRNAAFGDRPRHRGEPSHRRGRWWTSPQSHLILLYDDATPCGERLRWGGRCQPGSAQRGGRADSRTAIDQHGVRPTTLARHVAGASSTGLAPDAGPDHERNQSRPSARRRIVPNARRKAAWLPSHRGARREGQPAVPWCRWSSGSRTGSARTSPRSRSAHDGSGYRAVCFAATSAAAPASTSRSAIASRRARWVARPLNVNPLKAFKSRPIRMSRCPPGERRSRPA